MKPLLKNWLFKNKVSNYYCRKPLSLKAKGLFVFFILLTIFVNAQNLVPNPSFELYTSCPTAGSQINLATSWTGPNNSTDYYNSCSSSYFTLPYRPGGDYQQTVSGNAYAGFFAYNGPGGNVREYLRTQLIDTLLAGKCYMVSFYVNLVNNLKYAVNNIGLAFSNAAVNSFSIGQVLSQTSDIFLFENPIISDTLNWVKVSGIYNAIGNEQYITIGNFSDDAHTDTLNTGYGTYFGAYYFIDDVSVIPVDSIPGGMPANAGNDTSVVLGDSVFIGQQISNLNCNWYNSTGTLITSNTSGIYVHPAITTFYTVEQNLCGTITYDTIHVTVLPVGIHEQSLNAKINLFPNPNNGEFTIELPDGNNSYKISVADMEGRIICEMISNNKRLNIKPEAENGVYLVHITNISTNETFIKKLVIQK